MHRLTQPITDTIPLFPTQNLRIPILNTLKKMLEVAHSERQSTRNMNEKSAYISETERQIDYQSRKNSYQVNVSRSVNLKMYV